MTSFVPPMTMADFLQASRGTWLNRRSIHHLDHQELKNCLYLFTDEQKRKYNILG